MADAVWRHIPFFLASLIVMAVHFAFARWAQRRTTRMLIWAAGAWTVASYILGLPVIASHLPNWEWYFWLRGAGVAWGICSVGVFLLVFVWRRIPKPQFRPERRRLLLAAKSAVVAAPLTVTGYGVYVARNGLEVREVDIPVCGLAEDLDGLRIVQLTDIHCSPFLSRRDVARAVAMANEVRPHLAVVTGDLITSASDNLRDCLAELSGLKADAGIYGCLGNHEIYARAQDFAAAEGARLGVRFLRGQAARLRFGEAALNLAGVDYQRMLRPYLVGAERLVDPSMYNILLSHNPDVFPVAANKGFDLTLAGHTHGGQITVEILEQHVSLSRFFTPYVCGLYQEGARCVYVSRGVGTVGVPARIGAPPEISLIRLCAI